MVEISKNHSKEDASYFMRKAYLIALTLLLSACKTTGGVYYDKHTGDTIVSSEKIELIGGLFSHMHGTAAHSHKHGFMLITDYAGYGANHFNKAWSYGTQFPYKSSTPDVVSCSAGPCLITESGAIVMTKQQFKKASESGFDFKLVGAKGSIEAKVPPSIFQEVLNQLPTN